MPNLKLKINSTFRSQKVKKGDIITVEVDSNSIPLDQFWRRRLKDSKIDNCVEIVNNNNKKIKNV